MSVNANSHMKDTEFGAVENNGFEQDVSDQIPNKNRGGSVTKGKYKKDETEDIKRDYWDSPLEYLLSSISMSVGIGNVWRFPFTAYENGGGAFLIPYMIVLIFIARPIYFLEIVLGQFASFGAVRVWDCVPFFRGIGYIGIVASVLQLSYYCSIIATSLYYFIVSFQSTLPWTECNPEWKDCYNCTVSNCPQMYYDRTVTDQKTNINDGIGYPLWNLTICLAAAWTLIFLSMVKGIKSSGKVAYFTALFPYLVLLTFLIRGVTLEGSMTGIKYFITPQWGKIYKPEVWYAAVGQCFFSLSTGIGPITMLASYNPFRHPAYRYALIISVMDTFTSLLAGFTIFSVLGHLSLISDVPIEKVTEGGPGLVFVSYPSAIAKFPWAPQLFAVLFFLMMLTLGVGSANAMVGSPLTVLSDQFPSVKKWQMTLGCCILGFVSGLIYVTPGGQFMLTFMDYYGAVFLLYVLCMAEVIAIAWFYGTNNFIRDIEFMLGVKVGLYWKICWGGVIPVGLGAVVIYTFATAEALKHGGVSYPNYVHVMGWGMAGLVTLILPAWGVRAISRSTGHNFTERLKASLLPKTSWGPRAARYRKGWEHFKTFGEIKLCVPISDINVLKLSIRGIKERIRVTPAKNQITITLSSMVLDTEIQQKPSSSGLGGWLDRCAGKNRQTWIFSERGFENYRVVVESKTGILDIQTHMIFSKDYVITIKF